MFGNDAGTRLRVEVLKEDKSYAELKVHARLMGRSPKSATIYCSQSVVSIGCGVEALVEANILAEHLRQQVPDSGHVRCCKDGDRFAVQFALPEQPNTVEALPPVNAEVPPAEPDVAAAEKTTPSKRSR
jgi:hypothetical protein